MAGLSNNELPKEMKKSSKGLVNLKNEDNECFRWCHIRHLNPQERNLQGITRSDWEYIARLTKKHHQKIERQNKIRINVVAVGLAPCMGVEIYPIYISKASYEDCMNLLMLTEEDESGVTGGDEGEDEGEDEFYNHHVLIKYFNKLMYNYSEHKERKYFCMYCLQCFPSEQILGRHVEVCLTIDGVQAIEMPKDNSTVKFGHYGKVLPAPFVIYADFEALTEMVEMIISGNNKLYTNQYQWHVDSGLTGVGQGLIVIVL